MNISDIPAVYLTAQVALISVIFLYLTIVFCFPAYCWLDFCRQADGRYDILVCKKAKSERTEPKADHWSSLIYTKLYKPLMLGSPKVRVVSHSFVWIAAATLLGLGVYVWTDANQHRTRVGDTSKYNASLRRIYVSFHNVSVLSFLFLVGLFPAFLPSTSLGHASHRRTGIFDDSNELGPN